LSFINNHPFGVYLPVPVLAVKHQPNTTSRERKIGEEAIYDNTTESTSTVKAGCERPT